MNELKYCKENFTDNFSYYTRYLFLTKTKHLVSKTGSKILQSCKSIPKLQII